MTRLPPLPSPPAACAPPVPEARPKRRYHGVDNLNAAKKAKNDEFYTRREDIADEMARHDFAGKVVYCNCDAEGSEFPKFFLDNFQRLGLRRVIATGIDPATGEGRHFDTKYGAAWSRTPNGAYRENARFLEEADIVATNPPFSMFRDYVQMLLDWGGEFCVLGSRYALTTKMMWDAAQAGLVWNGTLVQNGNALFDTPAGGAERVGVRWFTNMGDPWSGEPLRLTARYDPSVNPRYDNADAIEVPSMRAIPMDFAGVMGVPVSYLDIHCPAQFEIVGRVNTPVLAGRNKFKRILIRNRTLAPPLPTP